MIKLINENEFIQQLRAIRKYFTKSYKQFIFEVVPEIKKQTDGYYSTTLDIDNIFNKVYGQLQINYFVKDNIAYIETFQPKDILHDMYLMLLPTYKGIPYRNDRDLFKIKLLTEKSK